MLLSEKVNLVLKRIRTARNEKGYSQDYVGERLGIGQRSYHRLENGKTLIKIETIFRLAIIFEVDATYFLDI